MSQSDKVYSKYNNIQTNKIQSQQQNNQSVGEGTIPVGSEQSLIIDLQHESYLLAVLITNIYHQQQSELTENRKQEIIYDIHFLNLEQQKDLQNTLVQKSQLRFYEKVQ
ncbi:Hypothetical_protein [Hexamita inflata]|uniref:Hypothetical_protein n=1 Tax=Hexamita inflata TaxID=28002 RepID=A0ABP1IAI3_9EUKA